jgi:hypothetical protein
VDAELFEALVYKLHEAELVAGDGTHLRESPRFCRRCHARIEYLMPVIENHYRKGADPGDW